ncbi:MAG: hypothetical protein J6C09_04820 [Clostridia bacterium]|nr:hypothetical protein [Clostridia bacterium]
MTKTIKKLGKSPEILTAEAALGNYAGTLFHEYGHTMEGTNAASQLAALRNSNPELAARIEESIARDYGITGDNALEIRRKVEALAKAGKIDSSKIRRALDSAGEMLYN